jgi:exopolyphosphatase/guanosine-5'-triphosphate,3'-diphosphate pyrophosphatase
MGVRGVRRYIGLAGTMSALAAIDQHLATYDRTLIHHHVLERAAVDDMTARLAGLTRAERSSVVGLEAGRVDVIVGGCLVLQAVLRATGAASVVHSEADILDGLAASLL